MKKERSSDSANTEKKKSSINLDRRKFLGIASGVGVAAGIKAVFGVDSAFAQQPPQAPPEPVKTNFDTVKDIPRTK